MITFVFDIAFIEQESAITINIVKVERTDFRKSNRLKNQGTKLNEKNYQTRKKVTALTIAKLEEQWGRGMEEISILLLQKWKKNSIIFQSKKPLKLHYVVSKILIASFNFK